MTTAPTTVQTDTAESSNHETDVRIRRIAGLIGVLGGVGMLASAGLMYSTGADLFTATADREMTDFLATADEHRGLLELHLLAWIFCAGAMCLSLHLFAQTSPRSVSTLVARFTTTALAGLAVVFFSMMFGVVDGFAGTTGNEASAQALGVAAVMADDLATIGILGLALITTLLSGRGTWAPRGLVLMVWPMTVISVLYLLPIPVATDVAGLLSVPVGIGTVIATGIVGIRGRS